MILVVFDGNPDETASRDLDALTLQVVEQERGGNQTVAASLIREDDPIVASRRDSGLERIPGSEAPRHFTAEIVVEHGTQPDTQPIFV